MRILGIDPGYATTGFGILQAERASVQLINYGTITTPTTLSFPERLEMLYDDMAELLDTVRPDAVAVEELFWGHNVTTGIGVSHGRGEQNDAPARRTRRCLNTRRIRSSRPSSATAARTSTRSWR